MNSPVRVIFSVLLLLIALALGLLLRHLLIKRFKDESLIQMLAKIFSMSFLLLLLLLAFGLGVVIITGNIDLLEGLLGFGNAGGRQTPLQNGVNFLWLIAVTGFLCISGVALASSLRAAMITRLEKQEVSINLITLVGRASYIVVLVIVFFLVLAIWDVQIALPAAIVTGVLTFALSGLIKDLVSGVFLLVDQPFQIGDLVTIDSCIGTVTNIHIRVTTMRLITGEEMIVPNGRFLDQNVTNNTHYRDRCASLTAIFAEADYQENETPQRMIEAIKSTAIVSFEQEPTITLNALSGRVKGYQAGMGGYNNRTIVLTVHFWVSSRELNAVTEIIEALGKTFPSADFRLLEFAANL